jgi:site-specific recombinase XerD
MKTLEQTFDACYDRFWANTQSERTVITNAKQILSHFGHSALVGSITTSDIDNFIKQLEENGDAPSTINRKLSLLSSLFTFAERRGYITTRPFIERKKVRDGRIRVISKDEETKLLQYFYENSYSIMGDFCVVAVDTGLRVGEILKLESAFVMEKEIYVPASISKTGQERLVPITRRVSEIMEARKASGVFSELRYKEINYRWNKMKIKTGITDKEFIPHAMRHTFCSRLAQAGTSPWDIKELAGHSNLSITERYTHHYDQSSLHKAIRSLEPA